MALLANSQACTEVDDTLRIVRMIFLKLETFPHMGLVSSINPHGYRDVSLAEIRAHSSLGASHSSGFAHSTVNYVLPSQQPTARHCSFVECAYHPLSRTAPTQLPAIYPTFTPRPLIFSYVKWSPSDLAF